MRILCYGDSNTWGYVPNINGYSKNSAAKQYDEKDCWWFGLKNKHEVFVDGLCGRCIAHENRWQQGRNALKTIACDLKGFNNLDFVVVQLGTNDCKTEYDDPPEQITKNLEKLLKIIKEKTNAKIVVIGPPFLKENNKITQKYYIGAQEKSKKLNTLFEQMAEQNGFVFVSGIGLETGEDGEHLTKLGHKQLRHALEKHILD